MDIKSKIIDYMLDFLVVEEIREVCYLSEDLRNIFQEEFLGKCNFIYTGSFVEGMINHSDIDIMHTADDFLVVESPNDIPSTYEDGVLLLDTEECYPGYTRLLLYRDIPGNTFDVYTNHNGKVYLDQTKYLNIKFPGRKLLNADMHGPALLILGTGAGESNTSPSDMVECFTCPSWPSFARKQSLNEFKCHNCHVVPIAHPNSSNPELEFRMSFSVAERELIRKWTPRQMQLYFLCKVLFKNYFQASADNEKGLCSYFAKTTIYWMHEELNPEFWSQNTTISILEHILSVLRKYLLDKSCPNYFIPNNHMMMNYTNKHVSDLLVKIDNVCKDIFYSLICCDIFVFADNKVLASIYTVTNSIQDDDEANDILKSIQNSDFVNTVNPNFIYIGGIKKLYCYNFKHYYMFEFMRFCLGQFLVGVPLHHSREFGNIRKRLNQLVKKNSQKKCIDMYICRCLAIIALSALFHIKEEEIEKKKQLLAETELLFATSMDISGELSDGAVTGGVYLGLFYYLTGQKIKSKKVLLQSAKSALKKHHEDYSFKSLTVFIPTEKTRTFKAPSFLRNENILRDLFEKRHLHGSIRFDPLFLCNYILHCTGENLELVRLMKPEKEIKDRVREASNYIRFRLGLYDEDSAEFANYSKEKDCLLCQFGKGIYRNPDSYLSGF